MQLIAHDGGDLDGVSAESVDGGVSVAADFVQLVEQRVALSLPAHRGVAAQHVAPFVRRANFETRRSHFRVKG